jgi:hypothetical protein
MPIISGNKFFAGKPAQVIQPAAQSTPANAEPGYLSRVAGEYKSAGADIVQNIDRAFEDKSVLAGTVKAGEAALRGAGDIAGAAFAPITQAVAPLVSPVVKKLAELPGISQGLHHIQSWAERHPEASKDLGAIFNLATLGGGGAAEKTAIKTADGAIAAGKDAVLSSKGAVSEYIAKKTSTDSIERTIELTRPTLNKAEKEAAVAAGQGKTGKGLFAKDTLEPTARDIERADVAHPFIAGAADENAAIEEINKAIGAKSEVIKTALDAHPTIFNKKQVRSYIAKFQASPERQILLAGDEAAQKAYNGVLDTFMSVVDRKPKTLAGLLEARKEFDSIAEKSIKAIFADGGTITARKQAVLDIRRLANQYIEDALPEGDAMKEVLHQQNLLFEAAENIATKGAKKVGTSAATRAIQKVKPVLPLVGGGIAGSTAARAFEILP